MAVVNNNLHPRTIGEGHALVNSKSQRPDTMILKDKIVKRCRNHKTQRSCTSIRKRLTISKLPIWVVNRLSSIEIRANHALVGTNSDKCSKKTGMPARTQASITTHCMQIEKTPSFSSAKGTWLELTRVRRRSPMMWFLKQERWTLWLGTLLSLRHI